MAQLDYSVAELVARYRGLTPPASEGDEIFRAGLRTNVLTLADESLRKEALTHAETDDLIAYGGWNVWDVLGSRATEGESGLIPRQEYETIAAIEQTTSYPGVYDLITDAVGADGVIELAGTARREIGTKANMLHAWAMAMTLFSGRGIALGLGFHQPSDRADVLGRALQFPRRLYRGLWGMRAPCSPRCAAIGLRCSRIPTGCSASERTPFGSTTPGASAST